MYDSKAYSKKYYDEHREIIIDKHGEIYRKTNGSYYKNRYKTTIESGFCSYCRKENNNNLHTCDDCRKKTSQKKKQKRDSNIALGLCANCGGVKDGSQLNCTSCRLSQSLRKKKYLKTENGKLKARINVKKNSGKYKIRQNQYTKQKMKTDIQCKLKHLLRNRVLRLLGSGHTCGSHVRDLGCTIEELKIHLESKFLNGMTWDNRGKGSDRWQIDHIYPLSKLDLTDREQFLKGCHYTNLQPLWGIDNNRKGNKVGR